MHDLSRVYPTSGPVTAGIGSMPLCMPELDVQLRRMDGYMFVTCFKPLL